MSRKYKFDPVLKVKLVERYLRNEIGVMEAARLAGLSSNRSFAAWVSIYRNEGPAGLLDQDHNKKYSNELKLAAVTAYKKGEGSLRQLAERFGLRSKNPLRMWLKEYNTHGEIKSRGSGGSSCMRKARQTTPEERLEIVRDCLANDKNYGAMALKYNCSYLQLHQNTTVLISRFVTGCCVMKRWDQQAWRTGGADVPAHSRPGRLKKSKETGSLNSKERSVISRWRMTC